jgi:hydrogenase expression/formation protein HypE
MNRQRTYRPRLDIKAGRIDMTHGSGGRATAQLFEEIFLPAFANPHLEKAEDQAVLPAPGCRLAVTTDGHVITPLFFPGGDIGSLSIHGTVNDLAVGGARPMHITAGFVIEEGFPLADLKRIADSMGEAARACGVTIVAGDTKVVERGKADGVFITTAGIGEVPDGLELGAKHIRPGDKVILSGPIGDHGIAILSKRENLTFDAPVESDSAPLHGLVAAMLEAAPGNVRAMRDATRGGLAAIMNEYAQAADVGFWPPMSASRWTKTLFRCGPRSTPPVNCWVSIRFMWRTKASLPRWWRPMRPRGCWRPCVPIRSAPKPRSSVRRSRTSTVSCAWKRRSAVAG